MTAEEKLEEVTSELNTIVGMLTPFAIQNKDSVIAKAHKLAISSSQGITDFFNESRDNED